MVQPKIGVSVIGLGVGEQHARAYAADPRCELRWLLDHDREKAAALSGLLGSGRVARDPSQPFEDDGTDVISIASFDDDHFDQVVRGLKHGKHLFVEKPLCRTVDELATVKAHWLEAGKPAIESNLVLRAAPVYRWLRERVADGQLGEVYAIDGDYLYGRLPKLTEGWRRDVARYSIMMGGGVHMIDLMMWIGGQRPASVATVGNRICTAGTQFVHNDFMASTFRFESGLVGRISANGGCVHRHQHVLRIFGTRATFILDDEGPRIHYLRDPGGPVERPDLASLPPGKGALIAHFLDGLAADSDRAAKVQHNFDVISVCAAADAALGQHSEMGIDYV